MVTPEANQERAVIIYQGSPLETIDTRALVWPDVQQPRFLIPDDIVTGRYGVVGFLVVDQRPEQRWVSYTDGEWTGVEFHETDITVRLAKNRSHYFHTDRGFKMIRYFILPPSVSAFFAQDRFLGEPMIDKCCREGTLPEEFDEDRSNPNRAFGSHPDSVDLIKAVVRATIPGLTDEQLRSYGWSLNEYAYVSFHPLPDFRYVIQRGQESVYAAIANFDAAIGRFDSRRVMQERVLEIPEPKQ